MWGFPKLATIFITGSLVERTAVYVQPSGPSDSINAEPYHMHHCGSKLLVNSFKYSGL